jgi:hypothetical protein
VLRPVLLPLEAMPIVGDDRESSVIFERLEILDMDVLFPVLDCVVRSFDMPHSAIVQNRRSKPSDIRRYWNPFFCVDWIET